MEKEISTYSFLPFSLQTFELCKFSKFRKIISNVISSQFIPSILPTTVFSNRVIHANRKQSKTHPRLIFRYLLKR